LIVASATVESGSNLEDIVAKNTKEMQMQLINYTEITNKLATVKCKKK